MKFSDFLKLNVFDLSKGLVLAVLTSVLVIVNDTINAGSFLFDWGHIWKTALAAAVAYLLKQLLTNNQGELLQKDK